MPLRQLGTFYHARAEAMGAADGILKVLGSASASVSASVSTSASVSVEKIISLSLKNIYFSYDDKKEILNQFNLTINHGDCIAITGPSGIGKSTILNLIAQFLVPSSGEILVNDVNLNSINQDSWREQIALLHQHPRLFHGTIADNIRFVKPTATEKEIEEAARITGVLDFTQLLPNGLNTLVGEQNLGLSGGQAQRVALARIVLKDAPLILLDEPTAHLDAKNTAIILELLKQWRGNKTVIIATHDTELSDICYQVSVTKIDN
jgi:ATP-binding cassette subfamily C protein CydD